MISQPPTPGEPLLLERPGGRRLAYSELGDGAGPPLIYCHGFPSSRREALLLHPTALRLGIRILAPDRPGCGGSDHQPGRTLIEWADDVAALADHLELSHISLLGVSGGAPYALACAWRLPSRIRACALVCPLGPVYRDEILAEMAWPSRLLLGSARTTPGLPSLLFGGLIARSLAESPDCVESVRAYHAPPADRDILGRPEVQSILGGAIRDPMLRGARGALDDLRLYTSPWDIPVEQIQVPIELWHGEADGTVPIAHARWYEHHLPHCRAHYLPEEGHYSVPLGHTEAILQSLLRAEHP